MELAIARLRARRRRADSVWRERELGYINALLAVCCDCAVERIRACDTQHTEYSVLGVRRTQFGCWGRDERWRLNLGRLYPG